MLFRFSILVVLATLFLIAAGGLVTSHEAGLAVPDWPTSYGQWFPPMVGNVLWEHGHRMIAGTVGILTLILAVWIQFVEKRKWLKILAWAAVLAVALQALLGGLTVIYLLPAPVSIAHATLAQTFFCLVVSIAYFLQNQMVPGTGAWHRCLAPLEVASSEDARLKRLLILTTAFIYLQLILGATLRHTGLGVAFHIILAFLILIHVLLVVLRVHRFSGNDPMLTRLSLANGVLVVCQIFLGLGAFIFTQMLQGSYAPSAQEVFFATAHQTLGAVILAISVLLTLRVFT